MAYGHFVMVEVVNGIQIAASARFSSFMVLIQQHVQESGRASMLSARDMCNQTRMSS